MSTVRTLLAIGLLTVAVVAWAALPVTGLGVAADIALAVACCCAAASVLRLVATGVGGQLQISARLGGRAPVSVFPSFVERMLQPVLFGLLTVPWPQLLIVAVVALEGLHPRRPWHTAVLGVVLLGYLIALHLAESGARLTVFRPQLPLIAAGICLAGISVAAAALPASGTGAGAGWLAALAAVAAIVVAALALPV